jgi:hypothetical protein
MFWTDRLRSVMMDSGMKEEVVCCNALRVVLGEMISIFFKLVLLLLLPGLVDEFLLSLSLSSLSWGDSRKLVVQDILLGEEAYFFGRLLLRRRCMRYFPP